MCTELLLLLTRNSANWLIQVTVQTHGNVVL